MFSAPRPSNCSARLNVSNVVVGAAVASGVAVGVGDGVGGTGVAVGVGGGVGVGVAGSGEAVGDGSGVRVGVGGTGVWRGRLSAQPKIAPSDKTRQKTSNI